MKFSSDDSNAAFTALDGKSFQGRLLHLLPAKAKVEQEPEEGEDGDGGKNFKKNKELKQKKTAGSSHNWNSLFLGGSAVADVLAEQYGVDKADVVLGEGKAGKTAAVNLALGETQIVAEVRLFLEEQGVSLDAFSRLRYEIFLELSSQLFLGTPRLSNVGNQ